MLVLIFKCDILSIDVFGPLWLAHTTDALLCWNIYIFRVALNLLGYDPKYANKELDNMMTELQ